MALVRKLGTRFGRPMNVEAAYFADSLYNAWQMEYKNCKNGILLVISVVDREVQQYPGLKIKPEKCLSASVVYAHTVLIGVS